MREALIVIWLGLMGLAFGSFVNAFIWRLHNHRNWMTERSECPHCHHVLAPMDLIPIVSWITLKGKCRYCHKKFDDTPTSELIVPVLFLASYFFWPISLTGAGLFLFILWLFFVVCFVALALYDQRWFILPNKIVFPVVAASALQVILLPLMFHYSWHTVLEASLGALTLSGLFYLLFIISDGSWIGGGDVKLAIALGLLAGSPLRALLILFVASVIGSLVAIPLLVRKGLKSKMKLPFGPLLIAGMIVVQLFGTSIINWYMTLTGLGQ